MGYNTDQIHNYMDLDKLDGNITAVIFKIFSESIICVITNDSIKSLSKNDVNKYLSKFSFKEEFDSYETESILSEGIKNKSLTVKFISEIFNKSNVGANGSFIATEIGYELKFKNNILVGYKSSDGLNRWAKEWKSNNLEIFESYRMTAKKYWGKNEPKILNEINTQADAYARTPKGAGNEYLEFHRNGEGIINFKMLLVTHYNEKINLSEFKEINFGRYQIVNEFNDPNGYKRTTYQVDKSMYTFDEKGKLINSYTSK